MLSKLSSTASIVINSFIISHHNVTLYLLQRIFIKHLKALGVHPHTSKVLSMSFIHLSALLDPHYQIILSNDVPKIATMCISREILMTRPANDGHITCATDPACLILDLTPLLGPLPSYLSTVLPRDYLGIALLLGLLVETYSNPRAQTKPIPFYPHHYF